jgi:hypothetical protein
LFPHSLAFCLLLCQSYPSLPFHIRILAFLQCSFPWKSLQLEWLPTAGSEAGLGLLLRLSSSSQNFPARSRESNWCGFDEIYHAIQQYVAHFSRVILQNFFSSPWIKNPCKFIISVLEGNIKSYLN